MTDTELQAALDRSGMTQKDAAAALGMSRRMLVYYLAGRWPVPKLVSLAASNWKKKRASVAPR